MKNDFIKYRLFRIIPAIVIMSIILWMVHINLYQTNYGNYLMEKTEDICNIIANAERMTENIAKKNGNDAIIKAERAVKLFEENQNISYSELKTKAETLGIYDIFVFDKMGESVFEKNIESDSLAQSEIFTKALFDISSVSDIQTNSRGEKVIYAAVKRSDGNGVIIISIKHDDLTYFKKERSYQTMLKCIETRVGEFSFIADANTKKIIAYNGNVQLKYTKLSDTEGAAEYVLNDYISGDGLKISINGKSFLYKCSRFNDIIIGYAAPVEPFFGKTGVLIPFFIAFIILFAALMLFVDYEWLDKNIYTRLDAVNNELAAVSESCKDGTLSIEEDDKTEEFALLRSNINALIDMIKGGYLERDKIIDENRFLLDEQEMLLAERQLFIEMTESSNDNARIESKARNEILLYLTNKMRIPVNVIVSICELVLLEPVNKEVRSHIIDMKIAAHNIISILNDITDISGIDAGKLEIMPETYYTRALIKDIMSAHDLQAKNKNIEIKTNVDDNIPAKLFGDKIRVHQVISNILRTSIKSMDKGLISISVNCEKTDTKQIKLIFTISDTGMGMKSDELEKLFKPFSLKSGELENSEYINNIEIEIARKLAVMMGGDIEVTSRYGHGSVFKIYIMQESAAEDKNDEDLRAAGLAEESMNLFSASEAKILVLDKNRTHMRIIAAFLELMDIKADICDKSHSAELLIKENKYDMIFISYPAVYQPDNISCIDFIKRIRELDIPYCHDVPVIAMVSDNAAGIKSMSDSDAINDTILKPIEPSVLSEIIRRYLPAELIKQGDAKKTEKTQSEFESEFEIEGIDISKGLANCGQSIDIYLDLLRIFVESLERSIRKIEKFKDINDFKNYKLCMNEIKTNAANIGAENLEIIADSLEEAAGEFNGLFISANTSELTDCAKKLIKAIKEYFERENKE